MVDYLERLWEQAGALLEQIQKMERSLPGPAGERDGGQDMPVPEDERKIVSENYCLVDEAENQVNQIEYTVNKWAKRALIRPEEENISVNSIEAQGDDLPERQTGGSPEAEDRGRSPPSPLAVQLERLDRAASAASGEELSRREGRERSAAAPAPSALRAAAEGPQETAAPGEFRPGTAAQPAPGGELAWAEWADRAFSRDSRRYDGGFYLY